MAKKAKKIEEKNNKCLFIVFIIVIIVVIVLGIYSFWRNPKEEATVNANQNVSNLNYVNNNKNVNQPVNLNLNSNLNQNINANLNENLNANLNANANSNFNANANSNLNTNQPSAVIGTEDWQDYKSDLLKAEMKFDRSWYYNSFYGDNAQGYVLHVNFSPDESIIKDQATLTDGAIMLKVVSKTANPTEYESLKQDSKATVLAEKDNRLYVLYLANSQYQETLELMAKTFQFTD